MAEASNNNLLAAGAWSNWSGAMREIEAILVSWAARKRIEKRSCAFWGSWQGIEGTRGLRDHTRSSAQVWRPGGATWGEGSLLSEGSWRPGREGEGRSRKGEGGG
jgi:hypothetical protein